MNVAEHGERAEKIHEIKIVRGREGMGEEGGGKKNARLNDPVHDTCYPPMPIPQPTETLFPNTPLVANGRSATMDERGGGTITPP